MEKVALVELPGLAKKVLAKLPEEGSRATLLALRGDLGAGKTTFVQALARELGVEGAVQSPTYVLMKSYEIPRGSTSWEKLVHIDLYRLEKPEELSALRLEEVLREPRTLVAIEWPERAGGLLPQPDLTLQFSSEGAAEGERYVAIDN